MLVLIGVLGMPLSDYATQIGLRLLRIPVMVTATGIFADRARV